MDKLWKFFAALLLIPLVSAFAYEAVVSLSAVPFAAMSWVLYGAVVYLLVFPFLYGDNLRFIQTFEHELCHAIFTLITFNTITEYLATANKGGHVKVSATNNAGFLTVLAPYFLPSFTLPFLLLRPFIGGAVQPAVDLLTGFTLAFHYIGLAQEFSYRQTDIQTQTYLFSLVIAVWFNLVILIGVVSITLASKAFFVEYCTWSWQTSLAFYRETYALFWTF